MQKNPLDGLGQSVIDVTWTTPAIANLMDTWTAFNKAFSNGGAPYDAKPFHYEIVGLNRTKLNLANLVPSLGYLNRSGQLSCHTMCLICSAEVFVSTGIVIGCKRYSTLDSSRYNMLKTIWLTFFFICGTDYFAASVGGVMFLYAIVTCDKSEQSDSNQHISDCPVRSVALTSGLLVVVLTIWLMPPFIHALTGRTMRAYGLAAGPCAGCLLCCSL